jgi:hypothetical protein
MGSDDNDTSLTPPGKPSTLLSNTTVYVESIPPPVFAPPMQEVDITVKIYFFLLGTLPVIVKTTTGSSFTTGNRYYQFM